MADTRKKNTYQQLSDAVSFAYSSSKSKAWLQDRTNEIWKQIKSQHKRPGPERDTAVEIHIKNLTELGNRKKSDNTHFFAQVSFGNLSIFNFISQFSGKNDT